MHVLVTGAKGMLGTALHKAFSPLCCLTALGSKEIDITDINSTLDIIQMHNPDLVINCAAYVDVDGCEINLKEPLL